MSYWILSWVFISALSPVQQLQKKFNGTKGFRVEFTQEVKNDSIRVPSQQAKGFVEFQKPSLLNWVYEKPRAKKIRYDGKDLAIDQGDGFEKIADPGVVTLQESLGFLWGAADLKNFRLEMVSSHQFRLIPKKSEKVSFEKIDVELKDGWVHSVVVVDRLEGISRLQFSNWKLK